MASIIKKKIRGQVYYYAVESKRVDGKPRIVWQKYLGKAGDIVQAVSAAGELPRPASARIYSFGAEAALLSIARRLGLEEVINRHAGSGEAGPGPGEYLLLRAINACTGAGAKMSRWFGRTVLRRHFKLTPGVLGEKRFWSKVETLSEGVLEKIQFELAERIISEFGVGSRALVYHGLKLPEGSEGRWLWDAGTLPGVGLLVSADYKIPLFYEIDSGEYPGGGTVQDCTERLAEKYGRLALAESDLTLVRHLCLKAGESCLGTAGRPTRILGTLAPEENEELLEIPLSRFHQLKDNRRDRVRVYRSPKKLYGKKGVVLVVYSEAEMARRLKEVKAALQDGVRELLELKGCLGTCGKKSPPGEWERSYIERRTAEILSRPYLKKLVKVSLISPKQGGMDLEVAVNGPALAGLKEQCLGKTVLFTDNTNWDNEEIFSAFSGRHELEEALGLFGSPAAGGGTASGKDGDRQRIIVFYTFLGLTLLALLRRELHRYGIKGGIPEIMKVLSEMREVAVAYAREDLRSRKREYVTLAGLDPLQKEIYECLRLSQFEAGQIFLHK